MKTIYISLAAILTLALVIGCSESDSNSTSSGSAGDIEGTYVYSLFRTFHLAGTVDNELEIIEDNYQNDGTGTYQVEADDGSFREQEPLTYQVLNTGEMNRRATLSDGSAFEMQGLFSHDKEAVVWIDNDHQDDASTANIGAGFGFKKPTSVLDFEGTYETVMVNNAKGAAAFKLSRLEYQINGDGTGHTISLKRTPEMTYLLGEVGTLTSSFMGQSRLVEMRGFASSNGDYFFLADIEPTDLVTATLYGIKRSTGATVSSISGEFHIAVLHNDTAGMPWNDEEIKTLLRTGNFCQRRTGDVLSHV